jgi:hypothetical protein
MISLKQHVSISMFIFIMIWNMYLKVEYGEVNKWSNKTSEHFAIEDLIKYFSETNNDTWNRRVFMKT